MKKAKLILFFLSLHVCSFLLAQNNVGVNTTSPHASAALMVDTAASGPQGMLIPRMTQARRNAIGSPAEGLMIYQTDATAGFYYYNGSAWTTVGSSISGGASLQLMANKVGGSGEAVPTSTTSAPVTVNYNNVTSSPTNGNTWTGNNTFTVGAGQGGVYMIQSRVHGADHPTPTNTVSYCLNIQINNTAWGTTNGGIVYGTYTPINVYTPVSTKARGEIVAFVNLNAGDTIKIITHGTNSSVAPQNIIADAGSNIMIMKMN